MRLKCALPALLLTICANVLAPSANAFSPGDKAQGSVSVAGKQVPLPRGEWIVAGASVQNVTQPEIGAYGGVRSLILAQVTNGKLSALAEINSNMLPVADGWGQSSACAKGEQFLLVTRYRTGWDLACFFIVATPLTGAGGPPAWSEARAFLAKANVTLPETALTVGFRASDRQDVVDLRLHFNPALLPGVPPQDRAVWTSDSVKAKPAQRRAIELLSAWALGVDGWIDRGLGNELPRDPVEGPQRAAILSETPVTDRKLADLENLYNRGAMDVAALGKQEIATLAERPVLSPDSSGLSVSIRKAVSYRLFGAAVDSLLAYVVTLGGPASLGLAATVVTVHSVIFVVNDQFWDGYFARSAPPQGQRVVDFAQIGGAGR